MTNFQLNGGFFRHLKTKKNNTKYGERLALD